MRGRFSSSLSYLEGGSFSFFPRAVTVTPFTGHSETTKLTSRFLSPFSLLSEEGGDPRVNFPFPLGM